MNRIDDSYNSGFAMGGSAGMFVSAILLVTALFTQQSYHSKRIRNLEQEAVDKGYASIIIENGNYKLVWKEEK